jgi:HK97 family phage prohead protease
MKITLAAPISIEAAEGDTPRRTISGLAVPYGVTAEAMTGPVRFEEGSLPVDGPAPKLIRDHNLAAPIGIVTARTSTPEGMTFTARISETSAGDEALTLAADGVLDSVSVGVEVQKHRFDAGVMVVEAGRWMELSLVPFGAFEAAKLATVAATAPDPSDSEEDTDPQPSEEDTMTTESPEAVEAAPTPTRPLVIAGTPRIVTPAEYISAMVTGNDRVLAAAAEQGTSDTPGLIPEPLIGVVYDALSSRRPFVDAIGTLAMPRTGEIFNRRKITQRTDVDEQSAEFEELTSQKMTVEKIPVTKKTYGGYVDLSEQEIDWTDPAAVNLVLTDMAKVYAKRTETVACAALVADVTEEDPIDDFTDGDEVLDAFYDASALINDAIDELPTHLMVSTDRWATLGKLKNAAGDRIFPGVGPMNAAGSMNPGSFTVAGLGLRVIVSNKFPEGTMILGHPQGIELYEQRKGAIRVDQPANLSVRLAFRGYFATLVIDAAAFVSFPAAADEG